MNEAASPPRSLRAALVRRAHGLHGEVRVEPLGGDSTRFVAGMQLEQESTGRSLRVRASRPGPEGTVLLAFAGIDTPEAAESLRGSYLCVAVNAARTLGADEWFVWQLVGMRCVTPDGQELGAVEDVEPAPAADVIVIRDGERVQRYPMVREFMQRVDVDTGVITVVAQPEVAI